MRHLFLLLAISLSVSAFAGQLTGEAYIGERFGRIEIRPPAKQWLMLDRESSGDNEFGGPVVDLKALAPLGGVLPSLHVSAFRRVDASVTAAFVLQTSRDAVLQKGGEAGPVDIRTVNGRKVWFFDAQVKQQDKPARLYYVLLEGDKAYFALQTVVPDAAFLATKQGVDELLPKVNY